MRTQLTYRQLEVVALVANGKTQREIASELFLSTTTIEETLRRAKKRTDARTLPHLVSIVIAAGMLEWSEDDQERQIQDGSTASNS